MSAPNDDTLEAAFAVSFCSRVSFCRDVLAPANPLLERALTGGQDRLPVRALVVVDDGLLRARPDLADRIQRYLSARPGAVAAAGPPIEIPGGEAAKNDPAVVDRLLAAVRDARLCRRSAVVVFGGGAVLDAAGFAAATAHRGVRLVRIPTTVLAQNDAGVGVKNGVNRFGVKNFLGTFAPPAAVLVDVSWLDSLEDRDWRAGIAEAVKVAVVKDAAFFSLLEQDMPALTARDGAAMERLVRRCAKLHLEHIAGGGDPFERGEARPLDVGHWAAHRLEALSSHRLRHGEAVAIGLALDGTYAALDGLLAEGDRGRLVGLLRAAGFPLFVPEMAEALDRPGHPRDLLNGLEEFREHLGGALSILLPREIGRVEERRTIDHELMREAVRTLRAEELGPDPGNGQAACRSETVEAR